MVQKKCVLCGSAAFEKMFSVDAGAVIKCSGCGLVSLAMRPDGKDELKKTYSEEYFTERAEYFFNDGVVDSSGEEQAHVSDFREGIDRLLAKSPPPGKLLDIGCATGSFLTLAKNEGWECYGAEISDYVAALTRERLGITIYDGSIKDAGLPDGFFDIITMWDLVEHLADPLAELKEIHRVLKPDGHILINTPNEISFIRKMARLIHSSSAGVVKFPINRLYHRYHLYYFDEETARLLIETAGFEVVEYRKKVIPITRGRGSHLAKIIVKGLSVVENALDSQYELLFLAKKK